MKAEDVYLHLAEKCERAAVARGAMASKTESLAVRLVRVLYNATDDPPRQWRMISRLDRAAAEAVELASARGWIRVDGGNVSLTDVGRQLAEDLAQPRH